jgi:AraC family transcriptional regulator of adaptative response/methylated-DNA-[protein]-cysteine methyltransferase
MALHAMTPSSPCAESTPHNDPRWLAVLARDPKAEGRFFYSVKTTGVYCRPSCSSRTARPEHVEFHASAAAAQRAGFRACKRCQPDQPPLAQRHGALVVELCRMIESAERPLSLAALARHAGLSVFHTQRVFKSVTGITPKAYGAALRARRVQAQLAGGERVVDAVFAAGFASSGRFYAQSSEILGMSPSRFKSGAALEVIHYSLAACSLGLILVAATARGVCAILLGEEQRALAEDLARRFPKAQLLLAGAEFDAQVAAVVALVEDPRARAELPLDIRGTVFQRRVWQALREIAPGKTASYTEIAQALGSPRSVRAVAQACAANPLAVAIPCHRVLRSNGELAGYRWGVERKRALLERESAAKPSP